MESGFQTIFHMWNGPLRYENLFGREPKRYENLFGSEDTQSERYENLLDQTEKDDRDDDRDERWRWR
jgi:hypothetical protein